MYSDTSEICNCNNCMMHAGDYSANMATGRVTLGPTVDFVFQGSYQKVEFTRSYYNTWTNNKPLGYGWSHSFNSHLYWDETNSTIKIIAPDGRTRFFINPSNSNYYPTDGNDSYVNTQLTDPDALAAGASGIISWRLNDGTVYVYTHFNSPYTGYPVNSQTTSSPYIYTYTLFSVIYPSGQKIRVTYDSSDEFKVAKIYDPISQRKADFDYDGNGRISHIDIGSHHVDYTIDGSTNLTTVNMDDAALYSYIYISGSHNVEYFKDAKGNSLEEITYWTSDSRLNRAMYVHTREHEYYLQYNDTAGTAKIEDLQTGIESNISYDLMTQQLLSTDKCLGSCPSAAGGTYLYDGYNNRTIEKNNTSITQSFYDYNSNLKSTVKLSSLSWVDGDDEFTDHFTDPDVNALNWRVTSQTGGTWQIYNGTNLRIMPSSQEVFFSSQDRVELQDDFTVTLKYNVGIQASNHFYLILANDFFGDSNWVKLGMNQDLSVRFVWDAQYVDPSSSYSYGPGSGGWTSRSNQEGYLIISREDGVIKLYVKDGLNADPELVFDTSDECPDCDYDDPMFIKFGGSTGSGYSDRVIMVDSIEVSGSDINHYSSQQVSGQSIETYAYNIALNQTVPRGTLLSATKSSLHGDSVTKVIYDYDADRDSDFNHWINTIYTSPHVTQIIKRGWVDTDMVDDDLETGTTIYTCFYYYPYYYTPAVIRGKLWKEYKQSTTPGCSGAPFTQYEYYESGVGDYNTGDLQYKCECTSTCECDEAAIYTEFLAYDDLGNPTEVEDANGNIVEYEYDLLGHMISQTVHDGANSYVTEYTYSGDILTQVEKPSGSLIKYSYNTNGNPRMTGMSREYSSSTIESMTFEYGAEEFEEEETGAIWKRTAYKNASGNTVREVYEMNGTTVYSNVKRKFQKTIEGVSGSGQSQIINLTIFDDNGNPIVKKVNPGLSDEATTSYTYNALNQLTKVTDAAGNTVGYEYDDHGNLNKINAHNGASTQVTQYWYDDFGRLHKSESPDAGETFYQYDARNNLVKKIDDHLQSGDTIIYTYDSLNRLLEIDYPNDPDIVYHYDGSHFNLYTGGYHVEPSATNALGRLTGVQVGDSIGDPHTYYTTYQYDTRGNVVHTDSAHSGLSYVFETLYSYDANGNLATITYPGGGRVVTYNAQAGDPDRTGRVSTYIVPDGVNPQPVNGATAITYHPFGDIKTMEYGNGLDYESQIDKRYFPKRITVTDTLDTMDLIYSPGPRGNIASIENDQDSDRDQTFSYDLKDQLVSATGKYNTFNYTYDALGNRLQQGYTVTGSQGNTITYSYTSGTNQLSQASKVVNGQNTYNEYYTYDDVGSISQVRHATPSTGDTVVLHNNEDSRLSEGEVYYGATVQAGSTYLYDHLGQRVMKEEQNGGPWTTVIFIYDIFGNLIEELDEDGNPLNTYVYLGNHRLAKIGGVATYQGGCNMGSRAAKSARANWIILLVLPVIVLLGIKYRKNRYVLMILVLTGAGVIIVVAMTEAKSQLSYSEAIYYYHNDHLGTPQVMTDINGTVKWDAAYEPFGKINEFATQTITNNFRFPGQYEDSMTGMYYNHHRYYMPEVGRYNKPDITKDVFAYMNLIDMMENVKSYSYGNNNSIRNIDSSGLFLVPLIMWPPGAGSRPGARVDECSYYNDMCQRTHCTYYCNLAPPACTNFLPFPFDETGPYSSCIRRCLIEEDTICYQNARRNCEHCPSTTCLTIAHIRCFTVCL